MFTRIHIVGLFGVIIIKCNGNLLRGEKERS